VHRAEAFGRDLHALVRLDELAHDGRLALVRRVSGEDLLQVFEAREVDAALEHLVADPQVRVGDLAHEIGAAVLHTRPLVAGDVAVPRAELARALGTGLIEQIEPKVLGRDRVVPRVLEAVRVCAVLQVRRREHRECEVKVPEDGREQRVGTDEEDTAGSLHLPVGVDVRI